MQSKSKFPSFSLKKMDDLPLNVSTHPPEAHEERERESARQSFERTEKIDVLRSYSHMGVSR